MTTNIRIILINTSHPGNIGAVARAMKTMGLSELYLVSPLYFPDVKASEMASNALDILEKAKVVQSLDEAIHDCGLVVGSSARDRSIPWPMLTPRELGEKAIIESANTPVGILFGRENSGLTNEELQRCHFHVHIPANPEYSSLNLAAAVQVIAYEIRMAFLKDSPEKKWDYELANAGAMEDFYRHLERVLIEIEFLDPKVPRQLMNRLRRLFNRARVDVMEMNILRGILGAIEKSRHSRAGGNLL
jgi:tRNA (cytidine32/uridine32-2'-O)-methyltransferase